MAIETTAVVVNDLNPQYPFPGDYISEGDDHLKLIKQVLKNTFPTSNTPMTTEFSVLNQIPSYMSFATETVNGAEVPIIDLQDVKIKNGVAGTSNNDFVILQQVKDLITTATKAMYPVGCYWMTDSNVNPADVFGFGTWTRVTAMLMGAGVVQPTGSIPNQSARTFTVGERGGSFSKQITVGNIPLLTSDFSNNGISMTASGNHTHSLTMRRYRISIDDTNGDVFGSTGSAVTNYTDAAGNHVHGLQGVLRLGTALENQAPLDVMPPYAVTNIWKRTS